jgi:hypothetical protein
MMRRVMGGMGAHATRDGAYCVREIVGIGSMWGALSTHARARIPCDSSDEPADFRFRFYSIYGISDQA